MKHIHVKTECAVFKYRYSHLSRATLCITRSLRQRRVRPSVCLSQPVLSSRATAGSWTVEYTQSYITHDFTLWQDMTRRKFRKRSTRAIAIYETGVGTNWRFFAIIRPITRPRRISETVQDKATVAIEH